MFQSLLFIFVVALAFCFTPGVFIRIPKKGTFIQVALIHALIFSFLLVSSYSLFVMKEKFQNANKSNRSSSNNR